MNWSIVTRNLLAFHFRFFFFSNFSPSTCKFFTFSNPSSTFDFNFNYDYLLSAFWMAFKITNNSSTRSNCSSRCRFQKLFSIVTQKSIKPSQSEAEKRVTGKIAEIGLWNLSSPSCTSTDNLHCIPSPVCLHMARISKTVNLNNFFVRLSSRFSLCLFFVAKIKPSETEWRWMHSEESVLMILLGLASFTHKTR